MSMIERDRYEQEEDVSEENIIRNKRWIIILGDPGSGKTSFARWLVSHLAQTLLFNGQHSTDYGPLRIPILIRIGEFAEILKEQPSLTLFDYIGKHKWMGKAIIDDPSISLDDLSCALQDYIKHGQALIILDGLDEISVSDQRSLIINIVENFVDTYVQTPTGASAFDNAYMSKLRHKSYCRISCCSISWTICSLYNSTNGYGTYERFC
jgi:predicted NACHT family NTPase